MVTKYDIFAEVYSRAGSQKIIDIVKNLKQQRSAYDVVRKHLDILLHMKLIQKTSSGYARIMNTKNQHLFDMIHYCLRNGLNYNEFFHEAVARYLHKAFLKKEFTVKDLGFHPKTFAKISLLLEQHGFLLVLSQKPFRAMLPYNSFLRDLVLYYGYRPLLVQKKKEVYFQEIQKEILLFKKFKAQNMQKYQELTETFRIRFIYHSLSIEGNPMTLPQTRQLLHEHIVPEHLRVETVDEVQNYQKAFLLMLENVKEELPLTKGIILEYHFIALQHKAQWAGKIRDAQVHIRGNVHFNVVDAQDISSSLDVLLETYTTFAKTGKHSLEEIFAFSSYLHNEFQHIHPFFDGNSRTTRLLIFHFLHMNGVPLFDIPLGLLEAYISASKGAKKRNDLVLSVVLQKIVLYNLKMMNKQLKTSF